MYRLEVSHPSLVKDQQISRLPWQTQERVNRAIAGLAEESQPPGSKKLTARDGYRIRVGDYRVLYLVDDNAKLIVIYRVMSRGDVYRV